MRELPVPAAWAAGTGASLARPSGVQSAEPDNSPGSTMAGIETAVEAARRYIIKRPRLTRLLDNANARVLMLVAPAGFGKTTLAREWVGDRPHVWYCGSTATADVAFLIAGLAEVVSELIPGAGDRAVARMRATGTPEQDAEILAELFAEDLADWPSDLWLVFDDYQFAMEADAPERFVDVLLRIAPVRLLLTSRRRPTWASARRLLYGEIYEVGRNELAMDHDEAAEVLAHRRGAAAAGLVALAEGWPAVIGLAALAEEVELPEGTLPQALHEFFAEELFQAAAPDVQAALCKLALAPRLDRGVTEFLLGERSADMIAEGLRLGFLTGRSETLEFHPLLRAFLETKSQGRASPSAADADALVRHLAAEQKWDDAFVLLTQRLSEPLFLDVLEQGLRTILAEARIATLTNWVELAHRRRIDAPIIDLAEAEIAFLNGNREAAELLALRAARSLEECHPMTSRAFCLAGASAHLDYFNDRAKVHYAQARQASGTPHDLREAVFGELNVGLDLEAADVDDHLAELIELDDGSAASEIRLAIARHQHAVRRSTLVGTSDLFDAAEHLLARVSDPHLVSSFYLSRAILLSLLGRYRDALATGLRCERYARDARLSFVVPHAKRARAVAELGLRHFTRCRQLVDWLEVDSERTGDVFVELESRLIRARMLIAQRMFAQARQVLKNVPERFPFEGDRGEYLATLGLASACLGESDLAIELVGQALQITKAVEIQTLSPCVTAIVALRERQPDAEERSSQAFQAVSRVGNVDSFVVAYRSYPALLSEVAKDPTVHVQLRVILEYAADTHLAKSLGLANTERPRRSSLSRREREVLALVAEGLTNKEIAKTLFISEATTKVHVRHIFEKLGVRSRTEAALRARTEERR